MKYQHIKSLFSKGSSSWENLIKIELFNNDESKYLVIYGFASLL